MSNTGAFALYVHIPFCTAKCSYCDFNSYAGQESMMEPYTEAVVAEARLWGPHLAGRTAATVFFGGGTPSLMPVEHMRTILAGMRENFELAAGAEVSLEANPGTVDLAHLRGLREAGFNRISFGVQSFHDEELLSIERIHSGAEAEQAYGWARQAGFENVNLDLIFGLIGQAMEQWQENVERALALGPDHLSLYALTLEDGTPLTRDVGRGRKAAPDPDLQADMYEWSRTRLADAGYDHYEISNWARPGRECRHNLAYWGNGDWLGIGAGAHSHLLGQRFATAATPSRYLALVREAAGQASAPAPQDGGDSSLPVWASEAESRGVPAAAELRAHPVLGPMSQVTYHDPGDEVREMAETVILGLRLRRGVSLAEFEARYGYALASVFPEAVRETLELGLTEIANGRLRLRDEAVLMGDEAFVRFLPEA